MNKNKWMYKVIIIAFLIPFTACDNYFSAPTDTFNRKAMLENYANNLILPAFTNLQSEINSLYATAVNFDENTTSSELQNVQTAWEKAYFAFQNANGYNMGPAAEQGLNKTLIEEIATFPVSVSKIENRIAENNVNFNDFDRDARGLLTVEYLLFSLNNDNGSILSVFENNKRKKYLLACIADIKKRVDAVKSAWDNGYKNEFIQNAGTDVGSSTSLLYNEFVKSYESVKNFKVGLPLGKRPGQIQAEPTLVEAYYSGKSLKFMRAHLQSVFNVWHGKNIDGVDGIGFYEYLQSIEGGEALIASTLNQWENVLEALDKIDSAARLSVQIESSTSSVDNLHTELQKHTRFFKSDMSSLMGITITFSSGDGD